MTPLNSFYLELLEGLLQPQFVLSDPLLHRSSVLDFDYSSKRFKTEGIKFLNVALYELRVATDTALESGSFLCPATFSVRKGTALPQFLYSHYCRIFHEDGRLLEKVYVRSLAHVRQVTSAFYKMAFPFTPLQEKEALENFVQNEVRIRTFLNDEKLWSDAESLRYLSTAALLIRKLFTPTNVNGEVIEYLDLGSVTVPKHGPGSVATGEVGLEKWQPPTIKYTRLHQVWPYYRYQFHSTSMLGDLASIYRTLGRPSAGTFAVEPVSKIALVPKDSRGPRIIAAEPKEVQYIQQGVRIAMTKWIETHSPTLGQVNFSDQTVNQSLAIKSSVTREWATIDMKDASDLVSVDLVKMVFRLNKRILSQLLACRTQFTRFPNNEEMRLKKFAGMGAATCFPVEALVFWSLSVAAIAEVYGKDALDCTHLCFVFGDDIIVPSDTYAQVTNVLESAGLRVNWRKSFVRGYFRESCGVDAFFGTNVTPTRFSKLPPVTVKDGVAYAAWVAYANDLEAKGYPKVAFAIYKHLENLFGPVPYGTAKSPFPCRIVTDPARAEELNSQFLKRRERKRYQRVEFYVHYVVSPSHAADDFDGWARLNRNLISGPGDDPSSFTLPREAKVLRGWMAV